MLDYEVTNGLTRENINPYKIPFLDEAQSRSTKVSRKSLQKRVLQKKKFSYQIFKFSNLALQIISQNEIYNYSRPQFAWNQRSIERVRSKMRYYNPFKSLPSSTQQLSLLCLLSLDNCKLTKDVSMIGTLNKLEILTLRMSEITSLHGKFCKLERATDFTHYIISSIVAPNWEKFDICVSDSRNRRFAYATQGVSFTRVLATGVKLEAFPEWFRQAVAGKVEKLSYQLCENLSNILEEYHHGNFDVVKSLYVDQCADVAQLIKLGNGSLNQPVFPQLEKLNIHHMQKIRRTLEVGEGPNLKDSLLPPNLIQRRPNLEEVQVTGTSIKAVFGFDGLTVHGGQLRKLKKLTLHNLSQLTNLWKGPSELVMFHRLEVVKVSQCENLRYIFPYAVCDYLCHLQVVWLEDCSSFEKTIGGHTDENGVHEVPESITLPRLTTLRLRLLPHLTDFYIQEAYLRCPELQRLHKQDCERLRTNLSDYYSDQEIQEKKSS
ncbi:uncharacterized protein LOC129890668 [Solanum dulcamara]|uniref:uncharacterized protein LOC129890668 n=1 Tax=Solanum dulcamara TaxID=45834 RepID=UPI0024864CD5|nr:uncharacterized protein LOC129890668 [Solanum dulcamara]